jgi:cobyrinic acid a,c-diamide synthase
VVVVVVEVDGGYVALVVDLEGVARTVGATASGYATKAAGTDVVGYQSVSERRRQGV